MPLKNPNLEALPIERDRVRVRQARLRSGRVVMADIYPRLWQLKGAVVDKGVIWIRTWAWVYIVQMWNINISPIPSQTDIQTSCLELDHDLEMQELILTEASLAPEQFFKDFRNNHEQSALGLKINQLFDLVCTVDLARVQQEQAEMRDKKGEDH